MKTVILHLDPNKNGGVTFENEVTAELTGPVVYGDRVQRDSIIGIYENPERDGLVWKADLKFYSDSTLFRMLRPRLGECIFFGSGVGTLKENVMKEFKLTYVSMCFKLGQEIWS